MGGYAAAVQNDQNLKNQQRAQTAALYWNAVQTELPPSTVKDASGNQVKNPAYDEALQKRENALKSYISYLGPEQHATIGNRIHGLIFGPEHQEMQQNATPPVSSQAPVPPGTAPAPATAAAPTHPFEHNPVYAGILKGLEGLGSHLKAAAHPLPPQPQPDYKALAEVPIQSPLNDLVAKYQKFEELSKGKTPEEQERLAELFGIKHGSVAVKNVVSPDGKRTQAVDVNSPEASALFAEGWKLAPTGAGGYIRQGSHVVNPGDAIKLMDSAGQKYPKQDGTDWTPEELAKFPKGTILSAFIKGDQTFYAPFDQRTKTATWDNTVHQINEAGNITPENATPLGEARVPTAHQVPGMNPGEKLTLTTTPLTPTHDAPTVPSSGAPTKAIPKKPWSKQPGAQASKRNGAPATDSVMGLPPPPFAPGTFMTQGKTTKPVIAAMDVVSGNVFGGNGVAPMWDNAYMYDNPELAKALNKGLTLNQLTIPGTEDDPTFMQTLATAVGLTGWSQTQIRNANDAARADIERLGGQKALDMFARLSAFQEDLTALRKATSGSAAASTVRTMVRAAPIYNVHSSQDFRNQLSATLRTGASALRAYPEINPKYIQWWDDGARMAKGGPVSSQAPRVGGAKHKVGDKVKLKNGQTIAIEHVYPDGSFD